MGLKDLLKGGKEVAPPKEVTKVGVEGKELNVNPSLDISLDRLEQRLKRVKWLLENKFQKKHPRYSEFMKIKGRLQSQIKLKKGEF